MRIKSISLKNYIQVIYNDFHYLFLTVFLIIFLIDMIVMPTINFWYDIKFSAFIAVFIAGIISVLLYCKPKAITQPNVNPSVTFFIQEFIMEPWICYTYSFVVTFTVLVLQIPTWDLMGNIGYCIAVSGVVSGLLAFFILIVKKVRYGKREV